MIEFKEAPLVLIGATDAPPEAYAALAIRYDLPIQLGASTPQAVTALREAASGARTIVAGVIEPRTGDSSSYRQRADALANAGADLLHAPGFASLDALREAALAMSQAKRPFAVAPEIKADGTMIDGTPLSVAIARLDEDATARPWHYVLACAEPSHAAAALETLFRSVPALAHRVVGLQVSPAVQTDPGALATAVWEVADTFGLHVLGVGRGAGAEHVEAIAAHRP